MNRNQLSVLAVAELASTSGGHIIGEFVHNVVGKMIHGLPWSADSGRNITILFTRPENLRRFVDLCHKEFILRHVSKDVDDSLSNVKVCESYDVSFKYDRFEAVRFVFSMTVFSRACNPVINFDVNRLAYQFIGESWVRTDGTSYGTEALHYKRATILPLYVKHICEGKKKLNMARMKSLFFDNGWEVVMKCKKGPIVKIPPTITEDDFRILYEVGSVRKKVTPVVKKVERDALYRPKVISFASDEPDHVISEMQMQLHMLTKRVDHLNKLLSDIGYKSMKEKEKETKEERVIKVIPDDSDDSDGEYDDMPPLEAACPKVSIILL
jgi:hypothetical protein